jgi:predicted DCC family thiol-disulfide oxidoreductase YuxK
VGAVGTLVFDGDCGFCTTSAGWARRIAPGIETVAWQLADLHRLGVSQRAAADAVQFVDGDGVVSGGAAAIGRLLMSRGGLCGVLGRLSLLPGVRAVATVFYKVVAANRYRLPGGTPACRVTS